jgi:hypothetical protein
VVQAQTAIAQGQLEKARGLLQESLEKLNPDDWAGYMLLCSVWLPATAACSAEQATEGLVGIPGGFSGLQSKLSMPEFWEAHACGAAADEAALRRACYDLDSFIDSIVGKVRQLRQRPSAPSCIAVHQSGGHRPTSRDAAVV